MDALVTQLGAIDKSTFGQDHGARRAVAKAARDLIHRLETPQERVQRVMAIEPWSMLATRIAIDLNLFSHIDDTPKSLKELATATSADPLLLRRLLRVLGTCDVVKETGEDTFIATEWSESLGRSDGAQVAIRHYYDIVVPELANMPEYFEKTCYRHPDDHNDPPFKYVSGSLDYWEWLRQHPRAQDDFNKMMPLLKGKIAPWTEQYPTSERLLQDFDASKPLFVDVGGGLGRDIQHFYETLPPEYRTAKLVLQDQSTVIAAAEADGQLPSQIQLIPHSFFTPQTPATAGAKTYFLRTVLHDWPDREALAILSCLKESMTPGYSKILLVEHVMPTRVAATPPIVAAMDLYMMLQFSALERTELQWRELAEKAGLVVIGIWAAKAGGNSVIELQCPSPEGH